MVYMNFLFFVKYDLQILKWWLELEIGMFFFQVYQILELCIVYKVNGL